MLLPNADRAEIEALVKRGATLGANSTIVCGHTIGRYALVGAGAVVTRPVPDHALIVGNPGRVTGWVCACGVKVASGSRPPAQVSCSACGAHYKGEGDALIPR